MRDADYLLHPQVAEPQAKSAASVPVARSQLPLVLVFEPEIQKHLAKRLQEGRPFMTALWTAWMDPQTRKWQFLTPTMISGWAATLENTAHWRSRPFPFSPAPRESGGSAQGEGMCVVNYVLGTHRSNSAHDDADVRKSATSPGNCQCTVQMCLLKDKATKAKFLAIVKAKNLPCAGILRSNSYRHLGASPTVHPIQCLLCL